MVYRLILIIFLGFIFVTDNQAQHSWQISGKSLRELKQQQDKILPVSVAFLSIAERALLLPILPFPDYQKGFMYHSTSPLPKAYRYQDLAFFCRIEVQMEQVFKFPVKFRLGEVQAVERKEGKY